MCNKNMKNRYEKKEILKRFKSKNGVGLLAYRGANMDKPIKYIEVEETEEYIDSFIENESEREYSVDCLLDDKVKELKNTFILKNFRVSEFRGKLYLFNGDGTINEIIEELKILMNSNERIEFNEDFGVGKLHYEDGKYLIELNVYCNMSFPIGTRDLKKVAKWLKKFHSGESNYGEPYNNSKALSCAFMKDANSEEERKKNIEDADKKIMETLRGIE